MLNVRLGPTKVRGRPVGDLGRLRVAGFRLAPGPGRGTLVAAKVLMPDGQPASGASAALGVAGSRIQVKNGDFDQNGTFRQRVSADSAGLVPVPGAGEGDPRPGVDRPEHPCSQRPIMGVMQNSG